MPVGSNKLQFKCTVCAVSFLSNALLLVHKANHGDLRKDGKLKVKPGKKFWCAICELNFLSKDLLCEHKATAAHDLTKRLKNNTFKCSLCDMGFASKENIRRHEIKQHKLEPYKCTLCTDTFARKCELVEHCADYHQGEKMPVKSKKIPHRSQFYIQLVYKPHLKTWNFLRIFSYFHEATNPKLVFLYFVFSQELLKSILVVLDLVSATIK